MALEEFTSRNSRDFRQRYQGVYGFYPVGGTDLLVKVTAVEQTYMKFQDKSGISYTANADKGVAFKFIPVERRLFKHKGVLVCIKRHPARQWQRGISEANTTALRVTSKQDIDLSFELLESYLHCDYEAEAAQLEDGANVSVLNPMVGITNGNVYVYDLCVGEYSNKVITLDNDLFIQEIKDVLNKHHLNIKVEV